MANRVLAAELLVAPVGVGHFRRTAPPARGGLSLLPLEMRMKSPWLRVGIQAEGPGSASQRPNLDEPDCVEIRCSTAGTGAGRHGRRWQRHHIARQACFARHQCQVGHRGCQVQLEPGLGPPKVAGLANPQCPAGPAGAPPPPATYGIGKGIAPLQDAGLLQQSLLRMQLHPSPFTSFGRNAPGPQRTYPTHCPVKLEGPNLMDPSRPGRCVSQWG